MPGLIALAIVFLLALAAGIRGGAWLTLAACFAVIPVRMLVIAISLRFFSIEFEPWGDLREVLYPVDDSGAAAPPAALERRSGVRERVWDFFVGINRPPTIEGTALQAGFLILALALVWASLVPVLRYAFPAFDADRSGPRGFPVAVHIDTWALTVTNGSDAAWTCRAELGRIRLANSFEVAARRTIPIEFARFDPNGRFKESEIRSAAQDQISLLCREPSGRRHFATLR